MPVCSVCGSKQLGQQGTEGLTERQKAIFNYLESKNGATLQEMLQEFKISETELRKEFAVLRHCELAKAQKRDNDVIFVVWNYQSN
ncbi:MAG: hypothetical protein ACOYVD_15995 [Bacillota bacterium]